MLTFILSVNLTLYHNVFGQNGDYIVFQDSAIFYGKVQFPGNKGISSINYRVGKKGKITTYTIEDISEFSVGGEKFFRKNIGKGNTKDWKFLERIPNEKSDINLWRLNESPIRYFIEKDSIIKKIEEGYQEILKEWLNDPKIEILIDQTKVNESDLVYLLKTASEIQKPRTFTKPIVFTPYIGVASIWHKYLIPSTFTLGSHQSISPTFGFNAEGFLNHKRNISINGGIQTLYFNSQEFVRIEYRGTNFESDIHVKFRGFQIPIFSKIYHDYIPNKARFYSELGVLLSSFTIQNATSYEGGIKDEMVFTEKIQFSFPDRHSGILLGFGLERYLKGHRGIVLGVRGSVIRQGSESGLTQIQLHSGFKF